MSVDVFLMCKDEQRYLAEWMHHYLDVLGFEKAWLYDNESKPPLQFDDPRVEIVRWPGRGVKLAACMDCCQRCSVRGTSWLGMFDTDEFLVLRQDANVRQFLARFPSARGVAVNWKLFGASGRKTPPRSVVRGFVHRSRVDCCLSGHVKLFVRPEEVVGFCNPHQALFRSDGPLASFKGTVNTRGEPVTSHESLPPQWDVACLNHYIIRSEQEWYEKLVRGRDDGGQPYPDIFAQYDVAFREFDDEILRAHYPNVTIEEPCPALTARPAAAN
ncbi:Glycosyltransferase family 92 [uncultured virus]|nr:Glycosyltransferase family 92 [uncultured virus]